MLSFPEKLIVFLLVWCSLWKVSFSDAPRYCPDFCDCSLQNEKNYADCRARRLISPNIELPIVVEILDLSYNDITTLDHNSFSTYLYLYSLILAHNSINSIHLDAFTTLDNLYNLDLSYNRLEYLDERLIEANKQLQVLNLEGNKFMSLPNQPFIRSSYLIHLNLRNSQINYINFELLKALPELRRLDFSHNLLINFQAAAFNAQRHLQLIDFEENPLNCDRKLQKEIATLQRRFIHVTVSDCKAYSEENDKTKIIETSGHLEIVESREENDGEKKLIGNIWHTPESGTTKAGDNRENKTRNNYFSSEFNIEEEAVLSLSSRAACNTTQRILCHQYHQCLNVIGHFLASKDHITTGEKITRSFTIHDLHLAFAVGAATSFSIIVIVATSYVCCRTLCCSKKRSGTTREDAEMNTNASLLIPAPRVQPQRSEPPPVPPRQRHSRRPRRRLTNSSDTTVATSDFYFTTPQNDNFVSRLFGRPARHQYYRALNQNAVTLIRSLSRGNLFPGRGNSDRESERYQPNAPSRPTSNFYMEVVSQSEPNTPIPSVRPETPPPKYGDIVAQPCDRH